MKVKKLLLSFYCLVSLHSFSQMGGRAIYSFLELPIPARTAALGGNLIGVKDDDINLSFQNPALLNKGMNNQLSFSYINYIADVNYSYVAYARSYDKIGHFALGLQNVGYGKFQEADEYGQITGTFKASDMSLNMSYARDIDSSLTYGVSLKTIYSNYYKYTSVGNALDAGLTYYNKKKLLTFSVVLKNFGYQWKTYTGGARERLPFDFQAGISKKVAKAPFRILMAYENLNKWDLTYSDPNNPVQTEDPFTHEPIKKSKFRSGGDKLLRHIVVGTEIIITKNFNLRVGYNYQRQKEMALPDRKGLAGFSFGLGLKISKFQISYGFAKYHVAGNSSHITITTNLSSFVKDKK
ncbi:MAG: type IX secretion system protein PorQ [Bacteroidia bacterium]